MHSTLWIWKYKSRRILHREYTGYVKKILKQVHVFSTRRRWNNFAFDTWKSGFYITYGSQDKEKGKGIVWNIKYNLSNLTEVLQVVKYIVTCNVQNQESHFYTFGTHATEKICSIIYFFSIDYD